MTETNNKNQDHDQSICFDNEKNQDHILSHSDVEGGRDHMRIKIKQESSTLKPLRKKRRHLTGW